MILVLWSSPNQDGLTAQAAERIAAGIRREGREAVLLRLGDYPLTLCRACGRGRGSCAARGECVIQDGFGEVYRQMSQADGLAVVTPVYWHEPSENLKCLIDRLRRCESAHNHFLKGMKVMLAACAGESGNGAVGCLRRMEEAFSQMETQLVERLPVTRFNAPYLLPALEEAGARFALLCAQKP